MRKPKMNYEKNNIELGENGYSILSDLYSDSEINQMIACIENAEQGGDSFMKTKDLFAIRQLIKNVPELADLLFNEKLTELLAWLEYYEIKPAHNKVYKRIEKATKVRNKPNEKLK